MNDLPKLYFTLESYLFPMLEEEIGELTAKMKEFLRIVELVKPSRFITNALRWCGLGRPMKDREKMLRAFFLKAVYDFPTTKGLIEKALRLGISRRSPIRSDIFKSVRNFFPGESLQCNPCGSCSGKLYRQIGGTRKP